MQRFPDDHGDRIQNQGAGFPLERFDQRGRAKIGVQTVAITCGFACATSRTIEEYSWRQLAGAGALAGIGFTMSLFIAGQAFPAESDFAAAKIAVFAASILSAVIGAALLWNAQRANDDTTPTD